MFKGRNVVTKISNGLLLFIFVIMFFSSVSSISTLISGSSSYLDGYSTSDYIYSAIVSVIYIIVTGIAILLLNKKIDLYKEEYPVSRQIFNLFFALTMLGAVISFLMLVCDYFIYDDFSFYLLSEMIVEAGLFILVYWYTLKGKILSKDNTKKMNIVNLIIIILLLEYVLGIFDLLIELVFKVSTMSEISNNLIIYAVGTCIVLIAYKLFNNDKTKAINEIKMEEPIKKEEAPKKKVKVVSTKKTTTKKKTPTKKKTTTSKTKKEVK